MNSSRLMSRFVNTRKRFLSPILSYIQQLYTSQQLDVIKTKRDLYNLLVKISREGNAQICNIRWINSFLTDENCCWDDEDA